MAIGAPTETATASGTSHDIDMPGAVDAGDLLVADISYYADGGAVGALGTPSGWTKKAETPDSEPSVAVFLIDAVGDEDGTSVDFTSGNSSTAAALVYRIPAAEWDGNIANVEISSVATFANSQNPDPPSISPSWGTAVDSHFFVLGGSSNNAAIYSGAPSGYTGPHDIIASDNGDTTAFGAFRTAAASPEDPSTFTSDQNEDGHVYTLAVKGIEGAPFEGPVIADSGAAWTVNDTGGGTANNIDLTKPTNVTIEVGDLLMLIVGNDQTNPGADIWNAVAGWSKPIEIGNNTSDVAMAVYLRIADGTEDVSVNVTCDNNMELYGWYIHIKGNDPTPLDANGPGTEVNVASGATVDITGFTVDGDNRLAFAIAAFDGGDGHPFVITGAGWALGDSQQSGSGGNDASGCWATKNVASGATGTCTVDPAVSDGLSGIQFAIVPAPSGVNVAASVDELILTEQQASISLDVDVPANTDELTLIEQPATVNAETNVNAGVDSLVLAEQPATIIYDVDVLAGIDALTLAEFAATVNAETNIQAAVDALILATFPATIKLETIIAANVDALILAEQQATVNAETNVNANTDALTVATFAATITQNVNVNANVDALALAEQAASVNAETNVQAGTDGLTLAALAALVNAEANVLAGVDALAITTFQATISLGVVVQANVDPLVLTEQPANVNAETNVNTNVDALALTTHQADITIGADVNVLAGVDALILAEQAANINAATDVQANVDALSIATFSATITLDVNVLASVDALTLAEQIANINAETNVNVGVDALTLINLAANVNTETNVQTNVDVLTLAEQAANINAETNIGANVDDLILTTHAATISAARNIAANTDVLILTTHRASVSVGIVARRRYAGFVANVSRLKGR